MHSQRELAIKPGHSLEQLKFRDPARARVLRDELERLLSQSDHAPFFQFCHADATWIFDCTSERRR